MTCDRCGTDTTVHILSMFNTDDLCLDCKIDEALAPGYPAARAAERAAVLSGDYNFPGVGISRADAAFLAERRQRRVRPETQP
jgi:hypothetical protein